MFATPITLTYNAVSVTMHRANQDNFTGNFRGADEANGRKFYLSIKHTVPSKGGAGESHLARLDVEQYDTTTGEYQYTVSVWKVLKTLDGSQVSAASVLANDALDAWMDSTTIDALLALRS